MYSDFFKTKDSNNSARGDSDLERKVAYETLVEVKPKIVLEVAYQEIQKSPNYESGIGLRFPRFVRIRDDKGPNEADTIERVRSLYKSQGRAG